MSQQYGANTAELRAIITAVGREHVIPIASNPGRPLVLANGAHKEVGKVPSRYSTPETAQAKGFGNWTSSRATPNHISNWARDPDHGFGIICREVRGIDIDYHEQFADEASEVIRVAEETVGQLAMRVRETPGRAVLAVKVPYAQRLAKGRIVTKHGVIELLGDKQQFVAAGTHPSGERYVWATDDLTMPALIELDILSYVSLIDRLVEFTEGTLTWAGGDMFLQDMSEAGAMSADDSPFIDWLATVNDDYRLRPDGGIDIPCPWDAEHTSGMPMDGSTTVYPTGTGPRGGNLAFVCMHAHCNGRHIGDYKSIMGYAMRSLSALPSPTPVPPSDAELTAGAETVGEGGPGIERPDSWRSPPVKPDAGGLLQKINSQPSRNWGDRTVLLTDRLSEGNSNNTVSLLYGGALDCIVRWDTFQACVMVSWDAGHSYYPFEDADYVELLVRLNRLGYKVSRDMVRGAVHLVAKKQSFDSCLDWLNALPEWDGVERIPTFFADHFGVMETADYVRAAGEYFFTATVRRIQKPGAKADQVPVLIGSQGLGKTEGIRALMARREWCQPVDLSKKDADLNREMIGRLVLELDELRGMTLRDVESLRSFISATSDSWVPKYQEAAQTRKRRCTFVGTGNKVQFINDPAGTRRWLPMVCQQGFKADVALIAKLRDQIWAEALLLTDLHGVMYQDAERLGIDRGEQFTEADLLADRLRDWLETKPSIGVRSIADGLDPDLPYGARVFTLDEAVKGLAKGTDETRVARRLPELLQGMGFARATRWINTLQGEKKQRRVWYDATKVV